MGTKIAILDILIFSTILIVPLALFLMFYKNKFKKYLLVSLFSSLLIVNYFSSLIYILISIQMIQKTSLVFFVFGTVCICLNYVLYYLFLKSIIQKQKKLYLKDFIHFIPIIFISAYVIKYIYFNFELTNNNSLMSLIEVQKLLYYKNQNNIAIILRILYPFVYLLLSTRLIIKLLRNFSIIFPSDQIKTFLFILHVSKIGNYMCFIFGLLSILNHSQVFAEIVKILFLIFSLSTSIYILANPYIIFNIDKIIGSSKKLNNYQIEKKDTIMSLNNLIKSNNLFLNDNYNLINLSGDSKISISNIREEIKLNGYDNYSDYINSFRICHANNLIQNGYLNKYSIQSLSEVSGFQSEVTFYRVFKKANGCTPKEYGNRLNLKVT